MLEGSQGTGRLRTRGIGRGIRFSDEIIVGTLASLDRFLLSYDMIEPFDPSRGKQIPQKANTVIC